jgi:hypothetical protein
MPLSFGVIAKALCKNSILVKMANMLKNSNFSDFLALFRGRGTDPNVRKFN